MTRAAWIAFVLIAGCQLELTAEEAREALDESSVASQASALMGASVEISTEFTIGRAVEVAADEIRALVASQLPCAAIALSQATLTIEYGANPGNCVYQGHMLEGTHEIEVERNEENDVVVHHRWDALGNGRIEVSGTATVTWSLADRTRHVVHELDWTRLSDGRMATGSGDITQHTLAGGLAEGIGVDGTRAWDGESGHWALDVDGIEMRWVDPVPQAGIWTLDTPLDKQASLSFERIDANTIEVTVTGERRSFSFRVNALGLITRS